MIGFVCWITGQILLDRKNHGQSVAALTRVADEVPKKCTNLRAVIPLLALGTLGGAAEALQCWRHAHSVALRPALATLACPQMRRRGKSVWIFPEGTRSAADEVLPFKLGAFHMAIKAQVRLRWPAPVHAHTSGHTCVSTKHTHHPDLGCIACPAIN